MLTHGRDDRTTFMFAKFNVELRSDGEVRRQSGAGCGILINRPSEHQNTSDTSRFGNGWCAVKLVVCALPPLP
jgi:hypothetical protein